MNQKNKSKTKDFEKCANLTYGAHHRDSFFVQKLPEGEGYYCRKTGLKCIGEYNSLLGILTLGFFDKRKLDYEIIRGCPQRDEQNNKE